MDRLNLGFTEDVYRRCLEREFKSTKLSDTQELVVQGCHKYVHNRIKALKHLPQDAQFKLHLAWASMDSKIVTLKSQIDRLDDPNIHHTELGDFLSRAVGYIPENASQSALAILPGEEGRHFLEHNLHLLVDRTTRGGQFAQRGVEAITDRLLNLRNHKQVKIDSTYRSSVALRRAIFNTRMMQALREAGYTEKSIDSFLAHGGHMHPGDRVMSPYQWAGHYDIDTVNDCLVVLPPSVSESLAREFWGTYKDEKSLKGALCRVSRPDKVRSEAVNQKNERHDCANTEMILRAIGVRDHEEMNDTHLEALGRFFSEMGFSNRLDDILPFWKNLRECRKQFHEILSLSEALKRKAT